MLTSQAEEDHAWAGFENIKRILAGERVGFENRRYYTPWDSPFDDLRRIVVIAGLAIHARAQLAASVTAESDEKVRWSRARAVAEDLERLGAMLGGIAAGLEARTREIYEVRNEVLAVTPRSDLNPEGPNG